MTKTMTLRLDAEKAAELETIARADEKPVSEAVRDAIDKHIEERRNDKEFQSRLAQIMEQERGVFERLAR